MSLDRTRARQKRHRRIRKQLYGTAQRPRFCVHRSLKHISAQLVDECEDETFYIMLYFHQDSKYLKSIKVESSKLLRSWQVNYEDYQDLDEGVIVPTRIEIGKWHGNEFKPHMNILNHHLKYDSRG